MFLVFEGIDGSGKTTQARLLDEHLRKKSGLNTLLVREPGGTVLGEKVRELVLQSGPEEIGPDTELFLFMASRAHLVRSKIMPALEAGRVVISDRFLWSSVVYQGISTGLQPQEILRLGRLAAPGLTVSKTFLIDIEPEQALHRVKEPNRMEKRGIEYQRRVRDGFLSLAERFKSRVAVIDGRGGLEAVHSRVISHLPSHGWSRCSSL